MCRSTLQDRGAGKLWVVAAAMAAAISPAPSRADPPIQNPPCHPVPAPVARLDLATVPSGDAVWSEVYTVAARRADAGSAEAARLALQMHRLGPVVYGMRFQVQRWQQQVACAAEPCAAQG